MRSAMRLVCAWIAALVLASCGASREEVSTAEGAATAAPDTCSAGALDGDTCSGSWQYPARCCATGYTAYNTCNHSHRFANYSYSERAAYVSGPCYRECDLAPGRGCVTICDPGYYVCGANAGTNALSSVNNVLSTCTKDPRVSWAAPSVMGYAVAGTTCTVTVANAPVSDTGVVNACTNSVDGVCGGIAGSELYGSCAGRQPAAPGPTGSYNQDGTAEAQVVNGTPGCAPIYALSTAGKTAAQLYLESPAPLSSTWVDPNDPALQPRCLTCEPHSRLGPAPLAGDVQGKFDCLDGAVRSLPAAKDAALKQQLTKRGQLLFEYYGHQLRDDQVPKAEGYYTAYSPPLKPDCGQAPDEQIPPISPATGAPAASCGSATGPSTASVDGTLEMCDRLRDAHVPAAVADRESATCANAWSAIGALGSTCSTQPAYVSLYQGLTTEVMRKGFASLPDTAALDRKAKLQRRMATTEAWYANMKGSGEDPAQLFRDSEIVAGAIVQGAYGNRLGQLDALSLAADPTQIQTRDNLILGSAADDEEVLNALLTPAAGGAPPLKNAPALWVLAHAMDASSRRLSEMDFLHDMGCLFRSCVGLSTKVSQMHGVFGAIADATALAGAPTTLVDPGWQTVFTNLAIAHASVLERAVLDARPTLTAYTPDALTGAQPSDAPVFALASIVRDSQAKANHYAATGRLRPGDSDAIYTGMLSAKLDGVMSQVEAAKTDLHNERVTFDSAWVSYLDQLVALARSGDQISTVNDELANKQELLRQYMTQLDGLRAAASVDQDRFGSFGKSYDAAIAKMEASDNRPYVQRAQYPALTVAPFDARYDGSTPSPAPADVAVISGAAPWRVRGARNDLVRIEASGLWSPTCAIDAYAKPQQTGFMAAIQQIVSRMPFTPSLQGYTGAMTGPQGYGIVYSNSTYHGRTSTDPDFNPLSYAGQAGAAIGLAIGGPVGGAVGGLVGSVFGGLLGGNDQSASVGGSEFRATAAFSAGLRVPTTPYPQYPAGSLLAVKADPTTGAFIDAEVVQEPSTTLVVDRPTDVYLVVNDTTCDRTHDPSGSGIPVNVGSLTVQATVMTPLAGYAAQVQPAMAAAYQYVQDRIRNVLIPQQMILPSDLPTMRSQALDYLAQSCGYCNLAAFEHNMMGFFTAFVDTALNQAERQVEIGRLDRQIRILTMEYAALLDEAAGLRRQSELLALLPAWSANNLDEDKLRWRTEALVEVVERELHPFIRGKYPEVLVGGPGMTGLRATPAIFDPVTVSLDWTRNWGAIAEDAINVVAQVQNKVTTARTLYDLVAPPPGSGPVTITVGVAIPKPQSMWTPDMLAAPWNYTGRYRELAPEMSAAVWSAIRSGSSGLVHIPVEALYRGASDPSNYAGQLDCAKTSPVIQSMAIYAIDDGNSTNSALNTEPGHNVQLYASDHLVYGSPDGPAAFNGANPAWLNFGARILYGPEAYAFTYYDAYPSASAPASRAGAGQGLSPFGRFTIGADPTQLDRPMVYALVVLMTVEYRNGSSTTPPSWIATCR